MALPIYYSIRNVTVRRASALLTALGIALTVAVFTGVFSLQQGFRSLYRPRGSETFGIYLRPGATSEGESGITREAASILIKERPEIVKDSEGRPRAAAEVFLAVNMEKVGGGLTNVPLRGIQPMTLRLHPELEITQIGGEQQGRWFEFGSDEVVVGRPLTERMQNCRLGDTLMINMTPFKVVGVFDHPGAYGSEIWGDADRMMEALERPVFQRVLAQVAEGTDFEAIDEELRHDARTPLQVQSERSYLASQTKALGGALFFLALFLTVIMGVAAVLGATNTMIASVSARTHEIGVLLAIGYHRGAIFLAFLLEAAVIGIVGGALGILMILPFNGYETGAMNWATFTDVSFAYRLTPGIIAISFGLAFLLGIIGGSIPALRAALMQPVDALRHQ